MVPQDRIFGAREVLQGIIDDLAAIKSKYPELAGWNGREPESSLANYGFSFGHNYTAGPGEIRREMFGQHGCYLGAWVMFNSVPQQFSRPPSYSFPNLRMTGESWVHVGSAPSLGFQAEVAEIFAKRFAQLQSLDAAAPSEIDPRRQ